MNFKSTINKIMLTIGSLTALGGASVGGIATWRSGWLDRLTPAAPVIQPVNVRLYGPTMAVRGDTIYFRADIRGNSGRPYWSVIPPTNGALMVMDDGRTASFRSLEEGIFSISVSVAGDGLQVASDHVEFENLNLVDNQREQAPAVDLMSALAGLTQPAMIEQPAPTVAELAEQALEQVVSEDRAGEARIVAGCFRSVISRVETGLVAPDVDPMHEIATQVNVALGQHYEPWQSFMLAAATIFDSLRSQGEITTAASAVPTLTEIVGVLVHAK